MVLKLLAAWKFPNKFDLLTHQQVHVDHTKANVERPYHHKDLDIKVKNAKIEWIHHQDVAYLMKVTNTKIANTSHQHQSTHNGKTFEIDEKHKDYMNFPSVSFSPQGYSICQGVTIQEDWKHILPVLLPTKGHTICN